MSGYKKNNITHQQGSLGGVLQTTRLTSPYFKKNYCDMHSMVLIMGFAISNDWKEILKNRFYHIIHVFTKVEKPSIVYYCAVLLVVVIQFCLISFDSCLLISIVYFLMKQLLLNLFL